MPSTRAHRQTLQLLLRRSVGSQSRSEGEGPIELFPDDLLPNYPVTTLSTRNGTHVAASSLYWPLRFAQTPERSRQAANLDKPPVLHYISDMKPLSRTTSTGAYPNRLKSDFLSLHGGLYIAPVYKLYSLLFYEVACFWIQAEASIVVAAFPCARYGSSFG